jgi:tetratricopeptide (TPR) repeat protein
MARYDRITPLPSPARERAFPGWNALRDLEGRERDPELGRRARLRFVALRPVLRLVDHGLDAVHYDSFERQLQQAREELRILAAHDPERARLAHFLNTIAQRTPLALVTATLDMGAFAEETNHHHAAEEYLRTALDLADRYRLVPEQVIALRLLGRLYRATGDLKAAERHYRRAAGLALELGDRGQWLRAMDGLATALHQYGQPVKARIVLREILGRARDWGVDAVELSVLRSL